MFKNLNLILFDGKYYHGEFQVQKINQEYQNAPTLDVDYRSNPKRKKLHLDSAFVHYLIKELFISNFYRTNFICFWTKDSHNSLVLVLRPTRYNLIDYKWNDRVYHLVREKCELDHALSWLSTLGGAFSALGDYFPNCADIAGKISVNQLKLAIRLGDPNIASRCLLFLSLSLIQKKKFRYAQMIVLKEYYIAKKATIKDERLLNMCKGIWCKLQYEHSIFKKKTVLVNRIQKISLN